MDSFLGTLSHYISQNSSILAFDTNVQYKIFIFPFLSYIHTVPTPYCDLNLAELHMFTLHFQLLQWPISALEYFLLRPFTYIFFKTRYEAYLDLNLLYSLIVFV